MRPILINCVIVWVWFLSGCAEPVDTEGYIVEPKRWPAKGWYGTGKRG